MSWLAPVVVVSGGICDIPVHAWAQLGTVTYCAAAKRGCRQSHDHFSEGNVKSARNEFGLKQFSSVNIAHVNVLISNVFVFVGIIHICYQQHLILFF